MIYIGRSFWVFIYLWTIILFLFSQLTSPRILAYMHAQYFAKMACIRACLVTRSCRLFATPWSVASVSSVHVILQTTILEWIAMPSLREPGNQPRDWTCVSYVSYTDRQVGSLILQGKSLVKIDFTANDCVYMSILSMGWHLLLFWLLMSLPMHVYI